MAGKDDGAEVRAIKPEDEEVDLDLDAEDEFLREAIGAKTKLRLDGKVIYIDHAAEWSNTAMNAATAGNWELWGREVIEDEGELRTYLDADLRNYQLEAIFAQCGKAAGTSLGKSRRSGRSSKGTRRR